VSLFAVIDVLKAWRNVMITTLSAAMDAISTAKSKLVTSATRCRASLSAGVSVEMV